MAKRRYNSDFTFKTYLADMEVEVRVMLDADQAVAGTELLSIRLDSGAWHYLPAPVSFCDEGINDTADEAVANGAADYEGNHDPY